MRLGTVFLVSTLWCPGILQAAGLTLNEAGYFENRGVNVLAFANWYDGNFSDSKISGIEIIHHGTRTATNGDVRLNATPEQWDPIPQFVERKADSGRQTVEAYLRYPGYGFDYSIRARADGDRVTLSVHLPRPLPEALAGRAGLNLEFLPSAYFGKTFLADGHPGVFPLYPGGPGERDGATAPVPLARGATLVLAPGDPERRVTIEAGTGEVSLYDGRGKAQNGWFVVRSLLPAARRGKVIEWSLTINAIDGWLRDPVIAHSQVGYHPAQAKRAVIELDRNFPAARRGTLAARLLRVAPSGARSAVKTAVPQAWGAYLRYDYLSFDFSAVTDTGVYVLEYAGVETAPFRIAADVYDDAWQPTLDVYFPVQMDHVLVNEGYRVWHGASHLDDALQAPVDHEHFDLYAQGPETETAYAPGEHIPGLGMGGWYDAGDYDIRTQSQYATVIDLVHAWERFALMRDTTRVDYPARRVDIHVPDGKPDLLQQIEHGALALIAQHRAFGRAIPGIIAPDISQYTHLGDARAKTDNLVYDAAMGPLESDGRRSGRFDDRWAFTGRSSALNYGSIAALAAAGRTLAGHNGELAGQCLDTAESAWEEERAHGPFTFRHGNTTGGPLAFEEVRAAAELLLATGDRKYSEALQALWPEIERGFWLYAVTVLRAWPALDTEFRDRLRGLAEVELRKRAALAPQNPFGVVISEGGWAGNGLVIRIAIANYYLHRAFPDLVDRERVFDGLNYLYGTHPGSDISFVSNVGTESKRVAYGMNRADFSFLSGGVVPGMLILEPDFPENKEDWPFMWGENEYVITPAAGYIFLVNAVRELLQDEPDQPPG